MANELYQFLGEQNVATFVNQLLTKTNIRVDERIVQTLDVNSIDKQTLSAKALHDLISTLNGADGNISDRLDGHDSILEANANSISEFEQSQVVQDEKLTGIETGLSDASNLIGSFNHLTIETVTGSIETVADPNSYVLYFQRDDENDTTWNMYVYRDGEWINVGDTEVDLSGIWSKDEVDELREALDIHDVEPISDDDIIEAIEGAYDENPVDYRMEPQGKPEVPSEVEFGVRLSDIPITGTMMYDGVEVPGTFTWLTTDEEFDEMMNSEE